MWMDLLEWVQTEIFLMHTNAHQKDSMTEICLGCQIFKMSYLYGWGLPRWLKGRESACQGRRCGFDLWVGKIPWRRKWQPTLVFLSGKSHKQRSLTGYSPWVHEESDSTEQLNNNNPCGQQPTSWSSYFRLLRGCMTKVTMVSEVRLSIASTTWMFCQQSLSDTALPKRLISISKQP